MTPIGSGPARRSATAESTPPLIATATRSGENGASKAGPIAFASASTASVSPPTAAASSKLRPRRSASNPSASASTIRPRSRRSRTSAQQPSREESPAISFIGSGSHTPRFVRRKAPPSRRGSRSRPPPRVGARPLAPAIELIEVCIAEDARARDDCGTLPWAGGSAEPGRRAPTLPMPPLRSEPGRTRWVPCGPARLPTRRARLGLPRFGCWFYIGMRSHEQGRAHAHSTERSASRRGQSST